MQLKIDKVGKQYAGEIWGLREFSLELGPGVVGLLGPNGAGKTTLMNILATVTKPTTGRVTWNGTDIVRSPQQLRSVLGYLPQEFGVYPNLNAVEFLHYLAAIKGVERKEAKRRVAELIRLVGLTEVAKRPLGTYSGGLKQRVGIAQALLNDPSLLIVDEPTVGLDPQERVRFRNLLTELSGDRVVILSTHIVSDVEAVASKIVLVYRGRMLADASPEQLLMSVEGNVWTCVMPSDELVAFRKKHVIGSTVRRSDGVHVRVVSESSPHSGAEKTLPTLEDAYLYHISKASAPVSVAKAIA